MTDWIHSKLFSRVSSFIALVSFFTFSYFATVYAYSFKEPDSILSILIPGYIVFLSGAMLVNLFYVILYYFEPKFFMQFRTNGEEFPWKERPKWWAQNVGKFVFVYVRVLFKPFFTLESFTFKINFTVESGELTVHI